MINKTSTFLTRISSTPFMAFWVIISLLFVSLVLPGFNTGIDTLSSGMGLPDQFFYYNAQKLKQIALTYGPEGRDEYVKCAFTYDLAWPIIYIGFLCILISWCNNLSLAPDSRTKRLNLVPLSCALFDALENISLSMVMLTFPDTGDIWLNIPGLFTAGKWICAGLSLLALGFSIMHAVQHRFTNFLEKP